MWQNQQNQKKKKSFQNKNDGVGEDFSFIEGDRVRYLDCWPTATAFPNYKAIW